MNRCLYTLVNQLLCSPIILSLKNYDFDGCFDYLNDGLFIVLCIFIILVYQGQIFLLTFNQSILLSDYFKF